MDIDLTQIIIYIIGLIASGIGIALTRYVIPFIKAAASDRAERLISETSSLAALYVQQKLPDGTDSEKLTEAVRVTAERLASHGYTLDEDELSECIEAQLKRLKLSAAEAWSSADA